MYDSLNPHLLPVSTVERLRTLFAEARRVVIFSHRSPDGDTIGSNMALRFALEQRGAAVTSVCADPIPAMYGEVVDCTMFVPELPMTARGDAPVDLYINVDGSSPEQLVFPMRNPELLNGRVPFISIDHHISNSGFAGVNLIVPDAPSTTFILYELFMALGWRVTPAMATQLLLGLYYDTGSFMHGNVDADVLEMAGELVRCGADRRAIIQVLYRTRSLGQMRAWGHILESVTVDEIGVGGGTGADSGGANYGGGSGTISASGGGVIAAIDAEMMRGCGARPDEISGVVDLVTAVPAAFSLVLSEDAEKSVVKGSLRTRADGVDVARLARGLGGGGHRKAAGFSLSGSLKRVPVLRIDAPTGDDAYASVDSGERDDGIGGQAELLTAIFK